MRATLVIVHTLAWVVLSLWTGWQSRYETPGESEILARAGVKIRTGVVYRSAGAERLALDVYSPSADPGATTPPRRRPAILAIHGGSWRGGSITAFRADPDNTIVRLAGRGLVVAAIDYRLARPASPSWPGVIDDVREAIRWMRRHAEELGIDPDQIAVLGQSSGAHLALLLGTLPDEKGPDGVSSRVQAVISFYGPSDLIGLMQARRLRHEPARTMLGVEPRPVLHDELDASPIHHVTRGGAPMLLLHGSDDAWVRPDQSSRMAQALASAGVRHRLILVAGARHGFEATVRYPLNRDLLPEILAFLENVWNVSN